MGACAKPMPANTLPVDAVAVARGYYRETLLSLGYAPHMVDTIFNGEASTSAVHMDLVMWVERGARAMAEALAPQIAGGGEAALRMATAMVHGLAQEYELRGDSDYTPAEGERFMLEDFGLTLLGEVEQKLRDGATHPATPAQDGGAVHSDDFAVDRFAAVMKAKLAKKRAEGRGGWEDKGQCTAEFLSSLLREHVEKGDPVDVGNLAMMLQQRGERIGK